MDEDTSPHLNISVMTDDALSRHGLSLSIRILHSYVCIHTFFWTCQKKSLKNTKPLITRVELDGRRGLVWCRAGSLSMGSFSHLLSYWQEQLKANRHPNVNGLIALRSFHVL